MRRLLLCLFLVSCAEPVTLVRGEEIAMCGPYNTRGFGGYSQALLEIQCIEDFKEQGFVRR